MVTRFTVIERRSKIKELLIQLLKFLSTESGILVLMGTAGVIILGVLYNKQKQIPGCEIEVLQDDTWFVNRDDKRRIAMIVSVKLTNKAARRVQIRKCKLSGYSPKENPAPIVLQGNDKTIPLDFPPYDQYYAGIEFYVKPYSTRQMWLYYESRSVTTTNLIKAPLVIKDTNRKRKSVRVYIPRHKEQILIYHETASLW